MAITKVVAAVEKAPEEAGVEIPFPYRILTLGGDVPVQLSQIDSLAGDVPGILRKPT